LIKKKIKNIMINDVPLVDNYPDVFGAYSFVVCSNVDAGAVVVKSNGLDDLG